jgi:hypothetical protein
MAGAQNAPPNVLYSNGVMTSSWFVFNWSSQSGNGATNPAQQIGLGLQVTGTATCTVQYTYQNPNNFSSPMTFSHPVLVNISSTTDSNMTTPVAAVRINQTAGSGSCLLAIVQPGVTP